MARMNKNESINNLCNRVERIFKASKDRLSNNIYRGHSRSINADIEDSIAIFLSELFPTNYYFIIDPSIYVNGKNHRPDLLVINEFNEAIAMIEIKSNMGWCRDVTYIANNLMQSDSLFRKEAHLSCKLSNNNTKEVLYGCQVIKMLVSLTNENCSNKYHENNKALLKHLGIDYYVLFSGWYNNLKHKDIDDFANQLMLLAKDHR